MLTLLAATSGEMRFKILRFIKNKYFCDAVITIFEEKPLFLVKLIVPIP